MRADLFDQYVQRRMVNCQIVSQQQQQPAVASRIMSHERPQQRSMTDVKPVTARINAGAQLIDRFARGRFERNLLHHQRRPAPHHLYGL